MNLAINNSHTSPVVEEFLERMSVINLMYFASDAGKEMQFGSMAELEEAVKRALEICLAAGLPMHGNFQRIYKCSEDGILYDWKLSPLAYRLVCISGAPFNPAVANLTIRLAKNES